MESILPSTAELDDKRLNQVASQEAVFCQEYARHGDPVMACVRAGIRDMQFPIDVVAKRLLARPDIALGIRLLQGNPQDYVPVMATRESEIADMEHIYKESLNAGKLDTAIAAKRLKTALMGLLVDRKEITHLKGIDEMTREELQRIAFKGRVVEGTAVEVGGNSGITDGGGYAEGE